MRQHGAQMKKVLLWLTTILIPVVLVLSAVRLLLTPLFIRLEYRMPYFPPDVYGFSQAERLHWAELARQYLLNPEDISFLKDLRFVDGSPLLNQRELRHMVDVKQVVRGALKVWWGSLLLLAGIGLGAWRGGWAGDFLRAVSRGGWLTVGLIGLVVVSILVSFNAFFVGFHRVFFEGDTWLFAYSDTLIRLFPERFWMDAFLMVGGVSLVGGLGLGWFLRGED